jgi:hypothetical protein
MSRSCREKIGSRVYSCGRKATRRVTFDDGREPVYCCGLHAQRFKRMPFATIQKRA